MPASTAGAEVLRATHGATSRYWTCVPGTDVPSQTTYDWQQHLDSRTERQIVAMLPSTATHDPSGGFGASDTAAARQYAEELRQELRANRCRLLTIRQDGELVGLVDLRPNSDPDKAHVAELAGIFIATRRRSNVVAAAFYEITRYCQQNGIESLVVTAGAGSAVLRFCKQFGFKVFGTLPDYTRVKGRSLPGYRMRHLVRELQARADAILWRKLDRTADVA